MSARSANAKYFTDGIQKNYHGYPRIFVDIHESFGSKMGVLRYGQNQEKTISTGDDSIILNPLPFVFCGGVRAEEPGNLKWRVEGDGDGGVAEVESKE